jgi:cbb3-type cytochrome oxidase cytochrome c subunit
VNNGPLLFFGILATLASSFWGLLLAPQLQIGGQQPAVLESTGQFYPSARPGLAQQGAEVYRAQGCVECHSQQVRQTGVNFEVWLADSGSNKVELAVAMTRLQIPDAAKLVDQAPVKLLSGLSLTEAQGIASQLTNGEAKAQAVLNTLGPDIQRGWGKRGTVTQDYLRDYPVQLGSQRVGPDLANYGSRNTNANVILLQLYEPGRNYYEPNQKKAKSMMPPFRYLFTKQKLAVGEQQPTNAVLVLNRSEKDGGEAIVPKPEAEALAAYLMSLQSESWLTNAPSYSPPVKTVVATAATEAK